MRAINLKLLRDLWHMKGQALAIVMIIASGVALCVTQLSALETLRHERTSFYTEQRFAQVFANCVRAPAHTVQDIRSIPGVDVVEARVTLEVMLDLPLLREPATGRLVSIPDGRHSALNDLDIRKGRMPEPGASGEVVVIEMFANANGYKLGDTVDAVINGRRRSLRMVGFALSPEFVYSIPAGEMMPDDRRYAVMWMNQTELAAACDMVGAYNDVTLTLLPGASEREVIARVDDILRPYGGLGAYPRKDQVSDWFLNNELTQLETFGVFIPLIFIGVAAFLLNVVLSRVIATQRDQVAALKAFGYSNLQVGLHFAQLVGVIILLGGIIGTLLGWWLGWLLVGIYGEYYHFPKLVYLMPPWVPVAAVLITAVAGYAGTFGSVRRAAALPPAEAMRPEAPPNYRATIVERIGLQRWLSQPTRMILRNLERKPFKSALTVVGLALAVSILVMGTAFMDIFLHVIEVQSNVMHREHLTVTLSYPRSRAALHELESIPGVVYAEPTRAVPATLRFRHRYRRVAIQGIEADAQLSRVLNTDLEPIPMPQQGILLSRVLGDALEIRAGDELTVEVLEGARPVRRIAVVALVDDFMGVAAYMDIHALNQLMQEGDVISGANLLTDGRDERAINDELRRRPMVGAVASKAAIIGNLKKVIEENLMVSLSINILFAVIIAFGVIYNAARVSLSERARELASLRVLGLTRGEISYILLGELAILTIAAVPLGFLLGDLLVGVMLTTLNSEVMRFPKVISDTTYALAASAVIVSATISGLLVRRRLDTLDLVEVLKSRE